jgi:hypothetical protein
MLESVCFPSFVLATLKMFFTTFFRLLTQISSSVTQAPKHLACDALLCPRPESGGSVCPLRCAFHVQPQVRLSDPVTRPWGVPVKGRRPDHCVIDAAISFAPGDMLDGPYPRSGVRGRTQGLTKCNEMKCIYDGCARVQPSLDMAPPRRCSAKAGPDRRLYWKPAQADAHIPSADQITLVAAPFPVSPREVE